MAPTPWIPRMMAVGHDLKGWSQVPPMHNIRGLPVYYPRCPHYPKRWVNNVLYTNVPSLDTELVWPWARRAAELIMARHPFDIVHANFLFPSGFIGLKLKERFNTPFVVHERSVQRMEIASGNERRRHAYRRILRAADVVITENTDMAARLREIEPAISDLRVYKQPGYHPDNSSDLLRPRPPEYRDRRVILSVGSLSERKGHAYLVRAVAELLPRFPDLACRIIGAGPEREKLARIIDEAGIHSAVTLGGKRPHDEVQGDMSWCDVFALPSWGEAGGTVYGEAMQFGKPIVACKGEGITDIARDQVHGRLVSARSVPELVEALGWLLEDASRRQRLGEAARQLAHSELSYPRLAESLIELYTRSIERVQGRRSIPSA
jgi:glycosyltransferase involved in cell wall biosynthesis